MSNQNITQIIKKIHQDEVNKQIVDEVLTESKNGFSDDIFAEVRSLMKKANNDNVVAFPPKRLQLAETQLMAAAGQNLGDWFSQPILFASSGMVVDIRKVLGDNDEVDVYIQPNSNDYQLIEKSLLPFKNKTLQVRLSVNGIELLQAEIYIDESGHSAEGSGHLKPVDETGIHGKLDFEIIVEE